MIPAAWLFMLRMFATASPFAIEPSMYFAVASARSATICARSRTSFVVASAMRPIIPRGRLSDHRYAEHVPERPRRPTLDEPISLHPLTGEDALRRLLGVDDGDAGDGDPEDDES